MCGPVKCRNVEDKVHIYICTLLGLDKSSLIGSTLIPTIILVVEAGGTEIPYRNHKHGAKKNNHVHLPGKYRTNIDDTSKLRRLKGCKGFLFWFSWSCMRFSVQLVAQFESVSNTSCRDSWSEYVEDLL